MRCHCPSRSILLPLPSSCNLRGVVSTFFFNEAWSSTNFFPGGLGTDNIRLRFRWPQGHSDRARRPGSATTRIMTACQLHRPASDGLFCANEMSTGIEQAGPLLGPLVVNRPCFNFQSKSDFLLSNFCLHLKPEKLGGGARASAS